MARVHLLGDLRSRCEGQATLEIEASTIRELIDEIEDRFPKVKEVGLSTMAVAIDGEVMSNADFEAVGPNTEVHFLSALSGG